jgi:carbamoyl-phosphate synthase large subunit
VSRSSALASKATGYPIAKIASLLAVGYTLDELPNEITGTSSACFEPSLDYTVVKVPRWSFEKFPGTPDRLGTTMQSVGEVMAIGRTFREALQKALRSLELSREGWSSRPSRRGLDELCKALERPSPSRLFDLHEAMHRGVPTEALYDITGIDPWFLDNLHQLLEVEGALRGFTLEELPFEMLRLAKREGFSDPHIARLLRPTGGRDTTAREVRDLREKHGLRPVFRRVDTCAAEFGSSTPYLYSTWEDGPCEANPGEGRKVLVLGSGPNRIGQGIEFDTSCCQAVRTLREEGVEAILANCNPETVSTDYDTSDRLYFEPLCFEEVMHILECEQPEGVIVSLGGQTPLNLAQQLHDAGVRILGTSVESIQLAEDRDRFSELMDELGIPVPDYGSAASREEAFDIARRIGFPVMVRPSFVLGGAAMRIVYDEPGLDHYFVGTARVSADHPVLIDRFLEDAVEFDVDAVCDGEEVVIGGILQHIEEAGVHSGDSFAVLPAYRVTPIELEIMKEYTEQIAKALRVKGLINIQFASFEGIIHVLEVNPRASRTVPFIEKATDLPMTAMATRCMLGRTLDSQTFTAPDRLDRVFVKGPVFPFRRFPKSDSLLGPEMKSTGEVMGVGRTFGLAFAKAQVAIGQKLPEKGRVVLSVNHRDKAGVLPIAKDLHGLGFSLLGTRGTADYLKKKNVPCEMILKVGEGKPNIADRILAGDVQMVINTPLGKKSRYDETAVRRSATQADIPCITTLSGARAAVDGISSMKQGKEEVISLQALYG